MVQLPGITLLPIIKLQKKRSLPLRILTSPKTTLALTGILAGFLFPGATAAIATRIIPKKIPVVKTLFIAGALTAVPSLAKTFNPFKAGQKAAPFIADPSKLLPEKDKPFKEKVIDVAKAGGLGVGVAAALIGVAALIGKGIKKLKPGQAGLPGLPGLPGAPGVSLPAAMAPVISKPFGVAEKPAPEKPAALPGVPAQPINIKILNNPEINIRFSKSRKFINQQLLIR